MDNKKLSHLEFVQGVINRLGTNSFLIKSWCITLVAALTVLSSGTKEQYVLVAYFPIIIFWFLDTYYLWQERLYRAKYNEVRNQKENTIDFSMKPSTKSYQDNQYLSTLFSKTIWPFYIILLATVLLFMFVFHD